MRVCRPSAFVAFGFPMRFYLKTRGFEDIAEARFDSSFSSRLADLLEDFADDADVRLVLGSFPLLLPALELQNFKL